MTKGCATRTRHIQRAHKCGKLPRGKNLPRIHTRSHTSYPLTHTQSPASVEVQLRRWRSSGVCVRAMFIYIYMDK